MLMEKAWCKRFLNYNKAEEGVPDYAMEEIMGCPSHGDKFGSLSGNEVFKLLDGYSKKKYFLVLSSKSADQVPKGIVGGHAYTLIETHEEGGVKLIRLRNPWGSFEWEGEYGYKSAKWT